MKTERINWGSQSHEHTVEKFYSHGVEKYIDFHNGYLNFGLWENGNQDYVTAAENLVYRVAQRLGLDGSSHLIDIACGMGSQDVFLIQKIGKFKIDGLDVTWEHINHGQRRARQAGLTDLIHFHHGSATALPFADATFTHALSIEGPVHFNTREKFFQETFRVLKPGGKFAVADYILKRKATNRLENLVLDAVSSLWKIPRANIMTHEEYAQMARNAGFSQIRIDEVGAQTIPGYYFEQTRAECRRELARIRGFLAGQVSTVIDFVCYRAYKMGLIDYILFDAQKV